MKATAASSAAGQEQEEGPDGLESRLGGWRRCMQRLITVGLSTLGACVAAQQVRRTKCKELPVILVMPRPVHWMDSPGGSAHAGATARRIVTSLRSELPGPRLAFRSRSLALASASRACKRHIPALPTPTRGASPKMPHPLRGDKADPSPRRVPSSAVAIGLQCLLARPIGSQHQRTYHLSRSADVALRSIKMMP